MSSGCKSAVNCIDARVPVRASYVNLYKWPESDAEFVRRRREGGDQDECATKASITFGPSPIVVDSYSCRQMYLRSYTFTRKESVQEKTRRCLGKVKEKAAVFPFLLHHRNQSTGSTISSKRSQNKGKNKRRKNKLKEASYSAICSIFHRFLSCTTSVDVMDR